MKNKLLAFLFVSVLMGISLSGYSHKKGEKGILPPPVISPAVPVSFCGSGILTVGGYSGNPNFQWLNGNTAIPGSNSNSLTVNSSGTYFCVVIFNNNNRDTTTGVVVTVNTALTVTVAASNNNICNGQNTTITANSSIAGATFSWTPTASLNSSTSATVTATPTTTVSLPLWMMMIAQVNLSVNTT